MSSETRRYRFRKALSSDRDWLFSLFKAAMQDYIDRTWGWDEVIQREAFNENLPPASFEIVSLIYNSDNENNNEEHEEDIAAYSLMQRPDHFRLEMLLMLPQHQRRGHGTQIIRRVQSQAGEKGVPINLSVLKVNPAIAFYERLGFTIESQDSYSYKLSWRAQ